MHTCPATDGPVPHVGGPIISGSPNVFAGGLPMARVTDPLTCVGPPDTILTGSPTVLINGLMAARMGDQTAHGGVIVGGFPTVLIGMGGAGPAVILAADSATPAAPLTREQVFRRLQDHTTNSARKIDRMGDQAYSKRQLNAIRKDENARPRFRGYQIDKDARKTVEDDKALDGRISGKPNKGPDFIDKDTSDQYDMTTQGQLQAHRLKYGDDLMHLDTSGKTIDPQPPMPPPKIAPTSPQGPPAAEPIMPEEPGLPIIDDIMLP